MPDCVSSNSKNTNPRSPFAFNLKSLCHADLDQHHGDLDFDYIVTDNAQKIFEALDQHSRKSVKML